MEISNKTKKVKKGLLVFIFFLVVALLIFLVVFLKKEQNVINEGEKIVNEENQAKESSTEEELKLLLISREEYLRENISELSPIKEDLGGTFYVTDINWLKEDLVRLKYEDGHTAFEAEVFFDDNVVAPDIFAMIPGDYVLSEKD